MMRLGGVLRLRAVRPRPAPSAVAAAYAVRALSSSSGDSKDKIKSVKAATEQLIEAVGGAMPGKGTIAAALVAASPLYSSSVTQLYQRIAGIVGAPTNQALAQLHKVVAELTGAPTPPTVAPTPLLSASSAAPAPMLPLPPVTSATAVAGATSQSLAAAYVVQFHDWVRRQPPEKTCAQLSDELQKWSESLSAAAAAQSPSPPSPPLLPLPPPPTA
jgi:hypothetical protein